MSEPLTDTELAAIRERAEKATEGPWDRIDEAGADVSNGQRYCAPGDAMPTAYCYGSNSSNNIRFIAHARTDVPRLLDEIDRVRRILATAEFWRGEGVEFMAREIDRLKGREDELAQELDRIVLENCRQRREIDRLKNCLLAADEFKREMLREHEREREQWKFTMDEQRRIDQNELRKALAEIDRLHQNLTILP